jgi:hypothetical protein
MTAINTTTIAFERIFFLQDKFYRI